MRIVRISKSDRAFPYYSTLPAIIVVFLVGVVPTLYSFVISLQSYELVSPVRAWVGLANYLKLFHDTRFFHAIGFALIFGFAATYCELVIGFLIAYLPADKEVPSRYSSMIRTVLMIPFVCAPVVMSYTYKTLIYDRTFGYLNYFLGLLRLGSFDLFKGSINAPLGLLVMEIILRTPFLVIIMYAGISSIDLAIYDAAEIDGITWLQKITKIVIPSIRAIILVGFALRWRTIRLSDTHLSMILMYLTLCLPLIILMRRCFVVDVPLELEEAAMVDGCSRWQTLRLILVPVLRPGILAAATLAFIALWNDFIFAMFNTGRNTRTLTVEIYTSLSFYQIDWNKLSTSAIIAVIPAIIFISLTQKYIVRGLMMGAIKG